MLRQDTEKQQNPPSKVAQAFESHVTLEPKCTLLMSKSPQTINTQVSVYLSHIAKIQLQGHSSTFWMKLKFSLIIACRFLNWACSHQQKLIWNAKSQAVTTEFKHTWAKRNSLPPMTSSASTAPALPDGSQLLLLADTLPLCCFLFPKLLLPLSKAVAAALQAQSPRGRSCRAAAGAWPRARDRQMLLVLFFLPDVSQTLFSILPFSSQHS